MTTSSAAPFIAAFALAVQSPAIGQNTAYVNVNAPAGGNGSSWALAYNTLHRALGDPVVSEVWVAQGEYRPHASDRKISFRLRSGVGVYGGFKGDETLRSQRDWLANETVFSGDLFNNDGPNFFNTFDNSFHVVSAAGVDGSAILDGFTVSGGNAEPGVAPDEVGAGVFAPDGQPTVRNCRFVDHKAIGGAGLYASGQGTIRIEDCSFENGFTYKGGGAIQLDLGIRGEITRCAFDACAGDRGAAVDVKSASILIIASVFTNGLSRDQGGAVGGLDASIHVDDCSFTDNRSGQGGAIGVNKSDLTVTNSQFHDNTGAGGSALGGAIALYESTGAIIDCAFDGNSASDGGAIWANFSDFFAKTCRIENSTASDRGGAISFDSGQFEMLDCRIIGNTGGVGGAAALALISEAPGKPHFLKCVFEANHSDGTGGALLIDYSIVSMMQCRVIGNTSNRGGGGIDGAGKFVNSIFAGNRTKGDYGGAIKSRDRLTVWQCTIVGNIASTSGGGIYHNGIGQIQIGNSILWDNDAILAGTQLGQLGGSNIPANSIIEYNCVEGGVNVGTGTGVITEPPIFVDPRGPDLIYGTINDDLRVMSYSPCRDAGSNSLVPQDEYDLDGDSNRLEPLPYDFEGAARFVEDFRVAATGAGSTPVVDIGAFEALPSECTPDLDPNGVLDIFDFLAFQNMFVTHDPQADLDHSTGVGVFDIFDFLVFQTLFSRGCGP